MSALSMARERCGNRLRFPFLRDRRFWRRKRSGTVTTELEGNGLSPVGGPLEGAADVVACEGVFQDGSGRVGEGNNDMGFEVNIHPFTFESYVDL